MSIRELASCRLGQLQALEHDVACAAAAAVATQSLVLVLRTASRLGDWGLSVAVGLILGIGHSWRALLVWTLASACGIAVQKLLKLGCGRLRPCERPGGPPQRAPIPDHGSFPSGHTLHAVAAAVAVSFLMPALAWLFILLASLIAASRVILGVHYPSDVAAGAALGAIFGGITTLLV